MKCVFSLLLFFLYIVNINAADDVIVINLDQAEETEIKLSQFVDKVEYIPLETTKNCLMATSFIYVTDQYFLAVGVFEHIFKFDRKSGRFIKEISRKGQGPEDYFLLHPFHMFDYKRHILYIDCFTKWRCLDILKEKYVDEIIKPNYRYEKEGRYQGEISNPYYYKDYYVGFMNNTTGKIAEKVALFTKDGVVLKSFPNSHFYDIQASEKLISGAQFYEYKKDLYFLPGADTVFRLRNETLSPHIVFECENMNSPAKYVTKELAGKPYTYLDSSDKTSISLIYETNKYVFFKVDRSPIHCIGYYDKKTKKTYRTSYTLYQDVGYINDIDGLLNFNLRSLLSGGRMVSWMDAGKLCEQYESGKLKSLSEHGKKIAEQTLFDDNPIVVIATLK